MKKIFIVYGHYNDASFNAAIKKIFIETAKEKGHEVDCVDLYKENFNQVFSDASVNPCCYCACLCCSLPGFRIPRLLSLMMM